MLALNLIKIWFFADKAGQSRLTFLCNQQRFSLLIVWAPIWSAIPDYKSSNFYLDTSSELLFIWKKLLAVFFSFHIENSTQHFSYLPELNLLLESLVLSPTCLVTIMWKLAKIGDVLSKEMLTICISNCEKDFFSNLNRQCRERNPQ